MLDTKALAEATALIVREHVDKATAPLLERIAVLEARTVKDGEPGKDGADGASVEPAEVERMIAEAVAKAVSEIPAPLPGKDGVDGDPGKDGMDGEPGAKGADGKDGAGIGDLIIDRDGALVATFTDGRTKNLGVVLGKDGLNGTPGIPGRDGLSVKDFDAELHEDGRTVIFSLVAGDTKHSCELGFPVVIYRDVWKEGTKYETGDAVTWAGSLWIAQAETEAKPDSGDGWRLSVKRGRDGKDKA